VTNGNQYSKLDKHFAEGNAGRILRDRSQYEHGTKSDLPIFYRFVVLETIFDPTIIDSNKISYFQHTLGVINIHFAAALPRNTIIARRVIDGHGSSVSQPMFLFPFFPHNMSFPCKPGEHVWVMFENPSGTKNDLGYWMCRIVEPGFVEDVNHTHSPRGNDGSFVPGIKDLFDGTDDAKYEFRNGQGSTLEDKSRITIAETATIPGDEDSYEKLRTETDGGKLSVYEAVPRYRKRPEDTVFEGNNNTLIVLGTDRTGAVAVYKKDDNGVQVVDTFPSKDDQKPGAGAMDFVVGRGQTDKTLGKEIDSTTIAGASSGTKELAKAAKDLVENEGDPDFINDRSRIYIAQRTKPDTNFGIDTFNSGPKVSTGKVQGKSSRENVEDSKLNDGNGDGAIVIKSDKLRLIARSDVEILVTGILKRDEKGRIIGNDDTSGYAALIIKANGDIIFKPSKHGYIKLGGDDATLPIVCGDMPAVTADGIVSGAPLITTMGGQFAGATTSGNDNKGALAPGQAKFASKILCK
jgi:hypothetical protein